MTWRYFMTVRIFAVGKCCLHCGRWEIRQGESATSESTGSDVHNGVVIVGPNGVPSGWMEGPEVELRRQIGAHQCGHEGKFSGEPVSG